MVLTRAIICHHFVRNTRRACLKAVQVGGSILLGRILIGILNCAPASIHARSPGFSVQSGWQVC
jgi:hypothetical protein